MIYPKLYYIIFTYIIIGVDIIHDVFCLNNCVKSVLIIVIIIFMFHKRHTKKTSGT